MTPLFIELYLDEDVAVLVADLVRARGYSALTTREARQLQQSDPDQLNFAVKNQKAFLTHNRADFENLHRIITKKV
jgi:predicted nuclease of predicted toxin-antitoxin system